MFKAYRIRRARERFLSSCRALSNDRAYWKEAGGFWRWLIERLSPVPTLGLHDDGEGLLAALEWLEANAKARALGEPEIRGYHRRVLGSRGGDSGEYRRHRVSVVGSRIPRAAPAKVPLLMKDLGQRLLETQRGFDAASSPDPSAILRAAVDLHQRIGLIHPFSDGNGRVARLAMNHLLRRYGVGYVIFPPLSEETPLWEALQKAHGGDLEPMVSFARECLYPV